MSFITTINNHNYTIEVGEQSAQERILLDGVAHMLDWQMLAPLAQGQSAGGHYHLIIAGQSYEVFARSISGPDEKDSQTYEIVIGEQRYEVKVEDERTRTLVGLTRAAATSSAARILSPMPGLVVNVLVEAGQAVQEGQTVVVLEAMKMENDLPSPITGTIKEVLVSKGQTVDQGQRLIVVAGE